jgi:hypoxanthine phosphoribosyltransferase
LQGKHVLLIEDMADSGLTLKRIKELIESHNPITLKIAVLVNRPDKKKDYTIDFVGL